MALRPRSRRRWISVQDGRFLVSIDYDNTYDGHRDRLHSYGLHRNGYDEEHTVASGRGLFMVSVRKSPVLKTERHTHIGRHTLTGARARTHTHAHTHTHS